MNPGAAHQAPATFAPLSGSAKTRSYPENTALKLQRLKYLHQERLAAIEAEKVKALKALELEKLRSIEALKKRTKEIEARSALKLEQAKKEYAALLSSNEKAIKALEANASRHHDQMQAAITRMQSQTKLQVVQVTGSYEQAVAALQARLAEKKLWILLAALGLLLLALFLFLRYRRESRLREQAQEHRHQAEMEARRQEHEKIGKILEIIAAEGTETPVKVELARLLGGRLPAQPDLIEYHSDAPRHSIDKAPPRGESDI